MNYEHSGEAESQHNHKYHDQTEVNDNVEDHVDEIIPPVSHKTEHADRALTETEDCQPQHKQLVQTGEDILFDGWN